MPTLEQQMKQHAGPSPEITTKYVALLHGIVEAGGDIDAHGADDDALLISRAAFEED